MSLIAVWVDRTQAKLAHYSLKKQEELRAAPLEHPTENTAGGPAEETALFEKMAQGLKNASDILILGPGVAKYHFRNYLNEQHPLLARKVGLFHSMDQPSEEQLRAFMERYLWSKSKTAAGS